MIIVQNSSQYRRIPEDIKTSDLEPYQANTRKPYIATYFEVDSNAPSTFVIGDGKSYKFKAKYYINKPLEPNSSYTVFLRYFENEVAK